MRRTIVVVYLPIAAMIAAAVAAPQLYSVAVVPHMDSIAWSRMHSWDRRFVEGVLRAQNEPAFPTSGTTWVEVASGDFGSRELPLLGSLAMDLGGYPVFKAVVSASVFARLLPCVLLLVSLFGSAWLKRFGARVSAEIATENIIDAGGSETSASIAALRSKS
jgi:hypothetical protein